MDNIKTENIGSSRNATSVMVISCGAFSTDPSQTDVSVLYCTALNCTVPSQTDVVESTHIKHRTTYIVSYMHFYCI